MKIELVSTFESKVKLSKEAREFVNLPSNVSILCTYKVITPALIEEIDNINTDTEISTAQRLLRLVDCFVVDIKTTKNGVTEELEAVDGIKTYAGVEFLHVAPIHFINSVTNTFFLKMSAS